MAVPSFSLAELTSAARADDAPGRRLLAELDAALADPGAFRLSGLPVGVDLVEKMHAVTCEFFELDIEEKAAYRFVEDPYVGWCGARYLSEYGSSDRKEMYHVGPRVAPTLAAHDASGGLRPVDEGLREAALASCTLWPTAPERFVSVWHEYYRAMQESAVQLGAVLARILGIDASEWFAAMGGNWADLAANYYPPIDPASEAGEPIYNAAHRDLTVFTILHQDQSRAGGLSVEAADGSWHDVEPVSGTYVVNVGELLTYLSGGRWRAAPHQVTVSLDPALATAARISVPFFYRPSDERVVRSFVDASASPVAVGDWVLAKKRGISARTS